MSILNHFSSLSPALSSVLGSGLSTSQCSHKTTADLNLRVTRRCRKRNKYCGAQCRFEHVASINTSLAGKSLGWEQGVLTVDISSDLKWSLSIAGNCVQPSSTAFKGVPSVVTSL